MFATVLLQFLDGVADRASGSVRHMYFLGAGIIFFVAILVVFAYFQQQKRRRRR
jgi:hypothetical protein